MQTLTQYSLLSFFPCPHFAKLDLSLCEISLKFQITYFPQAHVSQPEILAFDFMHFVQPNLCSNAMIICIMLLPIAIVLATDSLRLPFSKIVIQ